MRYVASLSLAALLLSTLTAHASSGVQVPPLPQGWVAVQAPALHGSFLHGGREDTAMLVQNGHAYGVAVIPGKASGREARIVRTFGSSQANPPQLSLIKPGSYPPVCHQGRACKPVSIATEAIGLCHGEASCEIIYFKDNAFHHLAATD